MASAKPADRPQIAKNIAAALMFDLHCRAGFKEILDQCNEGIDIQRVWEGIALDRLPDGSDALVGDSPRDRLPPGYVDNQAPQQPRQLSLVPAAEVDDEIIEDEPEVIDEL